MQVDAAYGNLIGYTEHHANPPFKPKLPEIAEHEQTPLVRSLLQIIGQQQEQIQRLEDELRRLQGGPPRPQLKPNTLEPAGSSEAAADGDAPQRRVTAGQDRRVDDSHHRKGARGPGTGRRGVQRLPAVCGAGFGNPYP